MDRLDILQPLLTKFRDFFDTPSSPPPPRPISAEGVAMDPAKVDMVQSWPTPRTLRALRGFLGLTGYYRCFINNYGVIATPLTALLKRDTFRWTDAATTAFEALKAVFHVVFLKKFHGGPQLTSFHCQRWSTAMLFHNQVTLLGLVSTMVCGKSWCSALARALLIPPRSCWKNSQPLIPNSSSRTSCFERRVEVLWTLSLESGTLKEEGANNHQCLILGCC